MFKKIIFHCDENGNPLSERRIILADDVNSTCFRLLSTTHRDHPTIQVVRDYKSAKGDPYNEDGRPPTVMLSIVNPVVRFCETYVEITGFEAPNLTIAGLLHEPYSEEKKPVSWLISRKRYVDLDTMSNLRPQKIILVAGE